MPARVRDHFAQWRNRKNVSLLANDSLLPGRVDKRFADGEIRIAIVAGNPAKVMRKIPLHER